ncbi:Cyanate hydratase [Cynara cardunculus var. scolymus]|uniref:Cyanate hydratase n=1 Tax=Cynara cardunculus var. scolymus TaxID=59895 RepID=A0A103Y0R4_CYNCS|nr:Cyanate hydratase [Cynara cardunculus var. scolymus]
MESETPTKASVVSSLMAVKRNSGKTFSQIAAEIGLTNVYVAQLLRRQAQLKPETAPKLLAALPGLTETHILQMAEPPLRSYDPTIIQDPTIYRMSAIDFFCAVDKVKGVDGKDRVVLTFDGKYLPHTEHKVEHMVSRLKLQEDLKGPGT